MSTRISAKNQANAHEFNKKAFLFKRIQILEAEPIRNNSFGKTQSLFLMNPKAADTFFFRHAAILRRFITEPIAVITHFRAQVRAFLLVAKMIILAICIHRFGGCQIKK